MSEVWYYWPKPSESNKANQIKMFSKKSRLGGAAFLAKVLEDIIGDKYNIIHQEFDYLIERNSTQIPRINVELGLFPSDSTNNIDKKYREKERFECILDENEPNLAPSKKCEGSLDADIVIIYDEGSGFRDSEDKWPEALKGSGKPIVIYNMYRPLFEGSLWEHVWENHKEKLILVLKVADLRKIGANISRSISWEKSAIDLLSEISRNDKLANIKELTNVIILFRSEGIIHYKGQRERSKLYFDPKYIEGEFLDVDKFGKMENKTLVFVANLSSCIISKLSEKERAHKLLGKSPIENKDNIEKILFEEGLREGLKKGFIRSREFLINGYGNRNSIPDFEQTYLNIIKRNDEGFVLNKEDLSQNLSKSSAECITDTLLPSIEEIDEQSDSNLWSILKQRIEKEPDEGKLFDMKELSCKIVKEGLSTIESLFPVGKFRNLVVVDRAEIESFRSIMCIMREYVNSEKNQSPLSIATFGSPGSGKSFGIEEIATYIDSERIQKETFDISQFISTKDLANAFHKVRDISLEGKIPLVFFDEFDSKFGDEELGWIKYFLVPMEKGKFMDFESMHPIGRSIFVFAGGTTSSFEEFCDICRENKLNKCPDFLSRLRGYVNIRGPNQIKDKNGCQNKEDKSYIIRRAILLRSLIEKHAPNIIYDGTYGGSKYSSDHAHVSPSLLNALINVSEYVHGVRSMRAIIEMSTLHGENSWEKAYLPPEDQLKLHIVDTKEFYRLLDKRLPC